MLNRKKALLVLLPLVFILTLFLGACTKTVDNTDDKVTVDSSPQGETKDEPRFGGDLIYGTIGAPAQFNKLYSQDNTSSEIEDLIYDSLVESNEKLEPVPALAESWESSEDGLTWTFKLKQRVKWHDGTEFTAEDVIFTHSIPKHADYDGFHAGYFTFVESVTAIDPYTVEFTLTQKDAGFLLGAASFDILPKHILGNVPIKDLGRHQFNTKNPIGTGPFKFSEWVEGEYVKVVAFDDYHEGRPYLDSITIKTVADQNSLLAQLEAGEIQTMLVPNAHKALPTYMEGHLHHPKKYFYKANKWWFSH